MTRILYSDQFWSQTHVMNHANGRIYSGIIVMLFWRNWSILCQPISPLLTSLDSVVKWEDDNLKAMFDLAFRVGMSKLSTADAMVAKCPWARECWTLISF